MIHFNILVPNIYSKNLFIIWCVANLFDHYEKGETPRYVLVCDQSPCHKFYLVGY